MRILNIPLNFFYNQITTWRKWWIYIYLYILMFSTKGNNWNMLYVGGWYTTMSATLIVHFSLIMHIFGRKFSCCYIMRILLTYVIRIRLIIWYLLCSTIIISGTLCITITPIMFCINIIRAVQFIIFKY